MVSWALHKSSVFISLNRLLVLCQSRHHLRCAVCVMPVYLFLYEGKGIMLLRSICVGSIFMYVTSANISAFAQYCSEPKPRDMSKEKERYRALQKRAAYAAFLGEACGFDNEVKNKLSSLSGGLNEEFTAQKRRFVEGSNFLSIKKRCILEEQKTKLFLNDVADEITSFERELQKIDQDENSKAASYRDCLDQKRIADQIEMDRIKQIEYERSEEFARKKAAQDVEAGFRSSLSKEYTYVLVLRNVSNRTADFQLKCYQNNGNYKTFPIALTAGTSTEIGYLEGWPGNFVSGEYCQAIYQGNVLWRVTKN